MTARQARQWRQTAGSAGALMRGGVLVLWAAATVHLAAQTPAGGVERLAWLQGCWEATSGDRSVEEHWMSPRGGSMLGTSRTVRRGQLVEYELIVVRERGDAIVYIAHPSGQPSAEFVAADVSEGRVVFQNPTHDFPQRIGYERRGDSLRAWIEGSKDGRARRAEFPYRRAACAAD